MQCRSQTFTTDEGSVPRAKGESFLGPGLGACPGQMFKSNSSEIVFSAFFQWIFHKIQTRTSVKRPDLLVSN